MRSVMTHQFSQVPRAEIPRSSFDRSHGLKTTFDADYLIPVLVDDIIPGDSFNVNMSFFCRLATPLHPIMDNMYLESFFFFCPYRLLWDNFEKFHGSRDDPADSIDYTIPVLNSGTISTGDLGDYMGLPLNIDVGSTGTSALPFRAYRMIWNEWFRDENLQDSVEWVKSNGPDTIQQSGFTGPPLKRGKRHDYFTGCLPWPQKGTAVSMPLGTRAEIALDGSLPVEAAIWSTDEAGYRHLNYGSSGPNPIYGQPSIAATQAEVLYADLSTALAPTINDIRLAFQTQRLLERDARGGTRYVEMLLAHYGVTSPDFRLQRPEFLGGGSTPINITPVPQTSGQPSPVSDDALGQLAGFGTVSGTHSFTKSFVEHGVLIGLVNVRGDITYSQGLERYWSKTTRFEYYYPALSNIGEQSVLNKEIFCQNTSADDEVFGYQERYGEYRYKPSRLTSLMRPDASGTLASWHLSEDFASLPTLGATFIQSNTGAPLDRAIAVNTEPHFIGDFFFKMKCARPMPLYGVPGNLDRF